MRRPDREIHGASCDKKNDCGCDGKPARQQRRAWRRGRRPVRANGGAEIFTKVGRGQITRRLCKGATFATLRHLTPAAFTLEQVSLEGIGLLDDHFAAEIGGGVTLRIMVHADPPPP